jgi:CxxC motif-containing protein (DUF1111 family)
MIPNVRITRRGLGAIVLAIGAGLLMTAVFAGDVSSDLLQFVARDPGVRPDPAGAGGMLSGLTDLEQQLFAVGLEAFEEVQSVQGTIPQTEPGLGPSFNLDSCAGCHAQPAIGGTSPAVNPQVEVATKEGAYNEVPFFITQNGPVREARFKFKPNGKPDGGVHALFTITGRTDAPGCAILQPDFQAAAASQNLIFRIPTPTFGSGLIEAIDDDTIIANMRANNLLKLFVGINGRPNTSGNDGTITRFGWKAQNKSLELFSGEAYNVEQGVTSNMFPQERDEDPACRFNATPESTPHFDATNPLEIPSDVVKFAIFMRFLAPPTPVPDNPSIVLGRTLFTAVGCALCHTPTLHTGKKVATGALQDTDANLFSDLLLHNMGPGLADGISQGDARGDEFRTAPLWGLGQRIFFLHDGRTSDLRAAIQAHASPSNGPIPPSEANQVIAIFNQLPEFYKQSILNFLRGL